MVQNVNAAKCLHETADTLWNHYSRRTFNGKAKPARLTYTRHVVSDVYSEPSYGSKGWFRLEDGSFTFMSWPSLHHAIRLRLQEVA